MALSLQQLTGAAERLREARIELGVDWLALVEEARMHASRVPFRSTPLTAFRTRGKDKTRLITQAAPAERLIEEALRPALERLVESKAGEAIHGYRVGRSTYTAALAMSRALAAGHLWTLQLDIRKYFDTVDWPLLDAVLAEHLPDSEARIVSGLTRAPLRFGPRIQHRKRGLPLGRVVSPYLANLYLMSVDEQMVGAPCRYLRYADDLLLLAQSEAELEQALDLLQAALAERKLTLNQSKTRRREYRGEPLFYLGHAVDERGVYDRLAGARLERIAAGAPGPDKAVAHASAVNRRSHTLYLTEPGVYLSINSGLLQIRRGKELLREIPIQRIDRVLVLSGAAMSSGFFAECVKRNIPVLFFVQKGRAFGSLVASGMPNPWRLRAQYELLSDGQRRLQLARDIVQAKIEAMRHLARRTPGTDALREALTKASNGAGLASTVEALRGFEGIATRTWYQVFALQLHQAEFAFEKRSKRPPRDPLNSLLSFSYSLIFGEMQTALLAEGLDPHPALLHESRPGHAALASDLIEPYRVQIADCFVRRLVNRRQIRADQFHKQGNGGVYLGSEGRRQVLAAFEQYMTRLSPAGTGPTPRQALAGAAASMLRVVLGEQPHLVFPPPFRKPPT